MVNLKRILMVVSSWLLWIIIYHFVSNLFFFRFATDWQLKAVPGFSYLMWFLINLGLTSEFLIELRH